MDNNGVEVLKWMSQRGYITPTQYKSAFDSPNADRMMRRYRTQSVRSMPYRKARTL